MIKIFLLAISLFLSSTCIHHDVWAHGGIPRVLSINVLENELWFVDTLGVFSSPRNPISNWSWLCDDAVDSTSGVDAVVRIPPNGFIALAQSGVYYSEDNGCTFNRVNHAVSNHSSGGINPHPDRAPEVLFYSDSLGKPNDVYLTEDGGQNWQSANLNIDGLIYTMWRSPVDPERVWITHAEGLSYSDNGGRTFRSIAYQAAGLVLRPIELSLIGGGDQAGQSDLLFMSVNRFPTSLLLYSVDGGVNWTQLHQVDDSYESLAFSYPHLTVSTQFQGLFHYQFPLNFSDLRTSTPDFSSNWTHEPEVYVGCLTYQDNGVLWGCGRGSPPQWLIGQSSDHGTSWSPMLERYQEAAGATWDCPSTAASIIACQTRCLGEGCDPSGLIEPMTMSENPQGGIDSNNEDTAVSTQGHGCQSLASFQKVEMISLVLLILSLLRRERFYYC